MPIVTVGKALQEKLGDEATEEFVQLLNQALSDQKQEIIEFVAERFERRLSEEIASLRAEMHEMGASIRAEMHERISSAKAELIKWMFIFWVGQVVTIVGILLAFFK